MTEKEKMCEEENEKEKLEKWEKGKEMEKLERGNARRDRDTPYQKKEWLKTKTIERKNESRTREIWLFSWLGFMAYELLKVI